MSKTFVNEITPEQATLMKQDLEEAGFTFSERPYSLFFAQKKGLCVQAYTSGKLVIQGKEMGEFIEFYIEPMLGNFSFTTKNLTIDKTPHIGGDESGKGDFFGPLCIAAVYTSSEAIEKLSEKGVQDSKTLTDTRIKKLKPLITSLCTYEVVIISPIKYNALYEKFQNLNTLLAWGHATAIEAVIQKTGNYPVLVDKFASESVLESAVRKKGLGIELTQKTKAESDIAVASASILARAAFVESLEQLGKEMGITLPKGASKAVDEAARKIAHTQGKEALIKCAKMHFKTADPFR